MKSRSSTSSLSNHITGSLPATLAVLARPRRLQPRSVLARLARNEDDANNCPMNCPIRFNSMCGKSSIVQSVAVTLLVGIAVNIGGCAGNSV